MANVVYIFNAAPIDIKINVNNGDQYPIAAASPSSTTPWLPGVGAKNPAYQNQMPAQNIFGNGANDCTITPASGGGVAQTTVNIPGDKVQPLDDLQLYIFYKDTSSVSWVLLANGKPVSESMSI